MGPDLEKGIVREANLLKKFYKERGKNYPCFDRSYCYYFAA
jgi:hypothetical protein